MVSTGEPLDVASVLGGPAADELVREETAEAATMSERPSEGDQGSGFPNRSGWISAATALADAPHRPLGQIPYLPAASAARSREPWTPWANIVCPDGRLHGEPMGARQSGQGTSSAGSRGQERSHPGFWQYIGRSTMVVDRYAECDGAAIASQVRDHRPPVQRQNSTVIVQAITSVAKARALWFIFIGMILV